MGRSCLSFSCSTGKYDLDGTTEESDSYYQKLYKEGRTTRVFTGEHTGLLGGDLPQRVGIGVVHLLFQACQLL